MAHPINKPIELGKQRELFVDKEFFINTGNAQIVMHRPQPKELAIFRDTVADDSATSYYNIIYAEGKYIAYYTAHGFGKNKKRSWYMQRPFAKGDYIALALGIMLLAASLAITYADGNRFFNPFL